MSEISKIILKVASFPESNYTLYPPITCASSILTLAWDIIWCWIVIIVNRNPLTSNLRSEDMVELRHQGISIDDDNNPAPENVPRQGENTTSTGN